MWTKLNYDDFVFSVLTKQKLFNIKSQRFQLLIAAAVSGVEFS